MSREKAGDARINKKQHLSGAKAGGMETCRLAEWMGWIKKVCKKNPHSFKQKASIYIDK